MGSQPLATGHLAGFYAPQTTRTELEMTQSRALPDPLFISTFLLARRRRTCLPRTTAVAAQYFINYDMMLCFVTSWHRQTVWLICVEPAPVDHGFIPADGELIGIVFDHRREPDRSTRAVQLFRATLVHQSLCPRHPTLPTSLLRNLPPPFNP